MKTVDLAVIGAGPAGMGAAIEARRRGLSVLVLDEQDSPGGQIYRGIDTQPAHHLRLGTTYAHGADLVRQLRACGADYRSGTSVWFVGADGNIAFSMNGHAHRVAAQRVILATGAIERPCPIPGWTLPGVMTAGAAQILLKTAGIGRPHAVFAGSGPLLYLVASQYARLGIPIAAVLDTTPFDHYRRAAAQWRAALRGARYLARGVQMLMELRRAGLRIVHGVTGIHAEGEDRLERVQYQRGGHWTSLETSGLFLHQGVIPHIQAALAAGCARVWDERAQCWRVVTDACGQTSQPAILLAGDAAAITGAACAPLRGELAALAAAHALGRMSEHEFTRRRDAILRTLTRDAAVRPFLETLYRPAPTFSSPPDPETVVCRCEEIHGRDVGAFARQGGRDANRLKSGQRCGMGPCQSRQCGLTLAHVMCAEGEAPRVEHALRIRPPIVPVRLAELAELAGDEVPV
ncbi:FAD-dependent oxidoreductase [Burkholderia sp. Bp9012]|uniref:FAD-dependent oxidoreductase n=1 Tax=Burkholderia sp. Bp9012 TaxID=2184562 RepID=UPI000F5A1404|nr:FAD-dependent oxidoreductase [Burkholderia sp. Bp9012]RQR79173.1 FAD-dependent oxidoreductase [Burkholderia sp. Bp9012]